jgi:16S rRNA processing protein RimM
MKTPRLVVVGQIVGAFGVRGEVRVRSFTSDPEALFEMGALLDAEGRVLMTPVRSRPLAELFGVVSAEARSREDWEGLRGTLLHVHRTSLPALEEDEVYVEDLLGCEVRGPDGRRIGVVTAAPNFGAGDLLEIRNEDGEAFFLPFTRECVPDIDLEARLVHVNPPQALMPEGRQRQAGEGGTNL